MAVKLESLVLTRGERETMGLVANINTLSYLLGSLEEVVEDISPHIPEIKLTFDTLSEKMQCDIGDIADLLVKTEDILGEGEK